MHWDISLSDIRGVAIFHEESAEEQKRQTVSLLRLQDCYFHATQKLPSSLLCDSCVWLNNFPGTQNKRETFPKYFLSFCMC